VAESSPQQPVSPGPSGFDLLTELGRNGWFIYVIGADEKGERRIAVGATKLGRRHEVIGESVDDAAPVLYEQAIAA
jgi:hypothetical protein